MREDHLLVCEPPDDAAFETDVRATIARLSKRISDESALVAAVADALRERYPAISIRSRDPIAAYSSERSTWHVYRDGRRGGHRPDEEPLEPPRS